jgi:hypothetical protein
MPQEMLDHCKAQNIPTSGNVVGKNSTTDFQGQPYVIFLTATYASLALNVFHSQTDGDRSLSRTLLDGRQRPKVHWQVVC